MVPSHWSYLHAVLLAKRMINLGIRLVVNCKPKHAQTRSVIALTLQKLSDSTPSSHPIGAPALHAGHAEKGPTFLWKESQTD